MAESGTFYLEIITPERQFYIGTAEALVIPAVDGEMGIYPGHEPVVTAIEPGELRYKTEGKWEPAAVGAGFAEVKPDYVILLVGFPEHPEEIDRRRAEAAKKRAEERLRQKQSIHEYYHSKAALARAMAKVYRRQTGGKLDITAVHVGLEPSVLGARHPGLTMISSGPDIVNPHSTDEHAPIDTLAPYVRLLAGTLEELART